MRTIYRAICLLGVAIGLASGCSPRKPATEVEETATQRQGPEVVRLLIVDDPAMGEAIVQLGAEWKARTGTTIVLAHATAADLESAESLPEKPDAVIYPSRLMGTLIEKKWIVQLPSDFASHRELAWPDLFELLQIAETNWSKMPYAVPLGSPLLMCYYRPAMLEPLHKQPPRDWQEFHEQAALLAHPKELGDGAPREGEPWHGVLQPLATGWAGRVLLARAAPYAKHRDHFSALFDMETMEPLIGNPAFVRALEELIADFRLGPPDQIEMDPDAVRREFLAGHAAFALTWPGHAGAKKGATETKGVDTGFAELPGSPVVYNFEHETWEKRGSDESWQLPCLGLAGRMSSVVAGGAEPTAAFQLLAWLAGREWGSKVSSASPATTLYRNSQVRAPQPWLDPGTDAAAAQQYSKSAHDALSRQQYLSAPRIPGEARYMAALDAAVHAVMRQEKTPSEALKDAAEEWRKITESLGVDAQKSAYRNSVGL